MTQKSFNVLDHGYVKFIESWGSDERIIESARMSTDGAFRGWGSIDIGPCTSLLCDNGKIEPINPGDKYLTCPVCNGTGRLTKPGDGRLLKYLYEHKHHTPFEMAGMTIEIQAPIFVFREWMRHRTQSYNELSARYTKLPDLYYIPTIERVMVNSNESNKQAGRIKGAPPVTEENAEAFIINLKHKYELFKRDYELDLKNGVPKELARISMPVGYYSRMRASANLRNWLAFLTLRMDKTAQWEIRQYANLVGTLIEINYPRIWNLFIKNL
jgi:thymidylate synthase (FAD)